jgi:sec-independent protein translocase protein TatB
MFEVGFTEIILILGLALLVLGPEKLPGLAEKVGRWTGRARAMARQLRTQLEQEVTLDEMTKSRPMQASPPPAATPESAAATSSQAEPTYTAPSSPSETAASADTPIDAPSDGFSDQPHNANPGLDLQTMVSGMEPPPQSAVETPAPNKVAH